MIRQREIIVKRSRGHELSVYHLLRGAILARYDQGTACAYGFLGGKTPFTRFPLRKQGARIAALSSDGDFFRQVDVLNGVEQFHAVPYGFLKGLTAGNEAHAAGAFIDDSGAYRLVQVVFP